EHPLDAAESDDIARAGTGAANEIAARTGLQFDIGSIETGGAVAEGVGAGDVGANEIALHKIAAGTGVTDEHAVGAVAGNEVGGGGGRATDEIAERGAIDAHAGKTVGERLFSSEVGADKISLDHGAIHSAHGDAITEARIAGNEIACARGGAANEVPIGTAPNPDPETAITNGIRTRDIGADEISEHKIVARAGIGNINAICLVAGNQIACAWTGS